MKGKVYLKKLVEDIHSSTVATIGADGHPQARVIDSSDRSEPLSALWPVRGNLPAARDLQCVLSIGEHNHRAFVIFEFRYYNKINIPEIWF